MSAILERVMAELQPVIAAAQAQIQLPPHWPAAAVMPWIETIWTNYISNAIKYGENRPILWWARR
ncbi:MAG: hypothetical protein R2911_13385 [Caldilineaceae bacterium]